MHTTVKVSPAEASVQALIILSQSYSEAYAKSHSDSLDIDAEASLVKVQGWNRRTIKLCALTLLSFLSAGAAWTLLHAPSRIFWGAAGTAVILSSLAFAYWNWRMRGSNPSVAERMIAMRWETWRKEANCLGVAEGLSQSLEFDPDRQPEEALGSVLKHLLEEQEKKFHDHVVRPKFIRQDQSWRDYFRMRFERLCELSEALGYEAPKARILEPH